MEQLNALLNRIFIRADWLSNESAISLTKDMTDWTGRRQAIYARGPIHGMFHERDNLLMEYILKPFLTNAGISTAANTINDISCSDFNRLKNLILWLMNEVEVELKQRMKSMRIAEGIYHSEPFLDYCSLVHCARSLDELEEIFSSYNGEILKDLHNQSVNVKMRFLDVYISYEKWRKEKEIKRRFDTYQPELENLYSGIFNKDSVFKTYGLIPADDKRIIQVMEPVRIFDNELRKTILLDIPKILAEAIMDMWKQGYIGKMAFRGTGVVYDDYYTLQCLYEEVERGRIFTLNLGEKYNGGENDVYDIVTKLYSKRYEDQLWIIKKVTGEVVDIYFEELKEDSMTFEEHIVTNMLHIQVYSGNRYLFVERDTSSSQLLISHMDFEYIYYTVDEFEKRMKNPYIKGEGRKRKKLFKLDNCRIPFGYQVNMIMTNGNTRRILLLLFVLNLFFEHKDLLNEYFTDYV